MKCNRPGRYRSYDHRLKQLAARTEMAGFARELGIPASSVRWWRRRGIGPVVTHEVLELDAPALQARVLELETRCAELEARAALQAKTRDALGWSVESVRFPAAVLKQKLLCAIESARWTLPLVQCLESVGLSLSRYKAWMLRQVQCRLEDYSSCPKLSPRKLRVHEVAAMREMVTNAEYSHFSVRALALHAARVGQVVASYSTWLGKIQDNRWMRPRTRFYPERPQIGIRAERPNDYWHVDVTILRLLDGTKAIVHACIDNFSRYVLAWKVARTPTALGTRGLLELALSKAGALGLSETPCVICDSGVENINAQVGELIEEGRITRKIAQIEIDQSNSLVEAFLRSLKHGFLFNVPLPSIEALADRMAFYVAEHNEVMPHAAFRGATPEEMYLGGWRELIDSSHARAMQDAAGQRIRYHRGLQPCVICPVGAN